MGVMGRSYVRTFISSGSPFYSLRSHLGVLLAMIPVQWSSPNPGDPVTYVLAYELETARTDISRSREGTRQKLRIA